MDIGNILNRIEKKKKYINLNSLLSKIENNKKSHFWIFLFFLFTLTIIMIYNFMPLDKMNPGHDAFFHYRRMAVLMEALKNNSFPVYLDYDAYNGYGYATKWFYPDFILIPFAFIGNYIGIIYAYKVLYFTMTILCGLFTYFATKRIYKNTLGAAITAILFTFCTYRLQDMYERFAVGEALSFTFIPLIFLGLYEIIKGDYKKWYIISIGFSLLIFTHVLSAILTFTTVIIIIAICYKDFIKENKRLIYLIIGGIVTVFLTAYFLFPLIEQYNSSYFHFQKPNVKTLAQHNRLTLLKILRGLFTLGFLNIHKYYIIPSIGLILIFVITLRLFIKEKSKDLKLADIGVIIGLIYIVSCLDVIPWSFYPFRFFNFIQFPWRLYEFTSFFFALAGGYYLCILLKKDSNIYIGVIPLLLGAIALVIIMNSSSYKKTFDYSGYTIVEPSFESRYHLMNLEYLPYSLSIDSLEYIRKKGNNIYTQNIDTQISDFQRIRGGISFNIKVNKTDSLELPIIYYKGYYASQHNKNIPIKESKYGMIQIPIYESGPIHVEFTGTRIQKYSIYITLVSYLLLCVYIYWYNRKNKKTNNINHVNTII